MEEIQIDESLYSRQQIMLGEEAMKRMAKSSVLISGFGGLGVEIAKNVALAGVKSLTLHDTKNTTWLDLSTNFYLQPSDIGKNRAFACSKHIIQLNPYVKYVVSEEELNQVPLSFFDQFSCVIMTDSPMNLLLKINDYCHMKNIRFIMADVRGLFTWVFCDFGTEFEIFDKNGEENKEVLIGKITKENPGVVTTLHNEKHGFEDEDIVTFREIRGMEELNGTFHKIKVLSPSSFQIGDTSGFSDYSREGIIVQTKQNIKMNFDPLRKSILEPNLAIVDFAKMERPSQMHIYMRALHAFFEKIGRLPDPWCSSDANNVLSFAKEINDSNPNKIELDENLIRKMAYTAQGSVVWITSFTGGMVAQECLKAISGKYTPLHQWLYLDGEEVMPPLDTDPSQFQPENNRLDGQRICLGKDLCKKLADLKLFMIGCGAIGCEMLKNFAMLGISTGNGLITVTDNDLIEKSNLNRQFLFRNKDLQKPKSESAANAAKEMNPDLKILAYLDKVGPDTEQKYSDEFFSSLDLVVNALDNINARLYVDSRCVTNKKPLLESGTLGPKGHVQVIIPFKTESYGSQRDPPEKDVPFCTLKSFPNQIEHCIEWARDFSFGGLFVSKPMQWNQLIEEPNLVEKLTAPNGGGIDIKVVRTSIKLLRNRPRNFNDCIMFARKKFEDYFLNKALQLLHNFPLDHKIDDKGTLFWTSPKRPPTAIKFDWNDSIHRKFIIATASLYAEVWNLDRHNDEEKIREIVQNVELPPFQPKSNKKIETDESRKKEEVEQENAPKIEEIEDVLKELRVYFSTQKQWFNMKVIDFEKDDDTNYHIDFIFSTSTLRARTYSIPEVDRLKTKAIAGRIMPAIATTTSCVSGCVSLELLKLVLNLDLDKFKNLFMNLALPFWAFSEPGVAERKKITSKFSYTLWDNWDVKLGDVTLGQFIKYFEDKYGLTVAGVFKGTMMVYVPIFPAHIKRKTSKMSALLKRVPGSKYDDLIVTFTDETGEDVSGPPIRYFYEK